MRAGVISGPHLSTPLLPPLQSDSYQEDIYPMTPGTEPALTPDEWLGGMNRGTVGVGSPEEASRPQLLPSLWFAHCPLHSLLPDAPPLSQLSSVA